MAEFVVIEQAEDGEAYITRMQENCIEDIFDNYCDVDGGNIVVLTAEAFGNLVAGGAQ
jgi:hypothetical protein